MPVSKGTCEKAKKAAAAEGKPGKWPLIQHIAQNMSGKGKIKEQAEHDAKHSMRKGR